MERNIFITHKNIQNTAVGHVEVLYYIDNSNHPKYIDVSRDLMGTLYNKMQIDIANFGVGVEGGDFGFFTYSLLISMTK